MENNEIDNTPIIHRLLEVEYKIQSLVLSVDSIKNENTILKEELKGLRSDTKDMVSAFSAAQGAFVALDWLAKVAKPIIFIVVAIGTFALYLKGGG